MGDSDLLTIEEAAKELGMTAGAVRKAIHNDRITPRRFSPRVVLIPRAEVERYKRERKPAGRPRATPRQEDA
jgi:excisionase family DNA binding protein